MIPLLADMLICPACLPAESPLACRAAHERRGDIVSGTLECGHCGARYPVSDGVARLLPPGPPRGNAPPSKYETAALVSSYLWSHYADLCRDPDAHTAYEEWADGMTGGSGAFIDAGCAVGRFTFDMSRKYDVAVGIDNSAPFIKTARTLKMDGKLEATIPEEGRLRRPFRIDLSSRLRPENVDFVVADVTAIPFRAGAFAGAASLNIVDKVPDPLLHLEEINRVARNAGAELLFSDPFSWSEEAADCSRWLGGTRDGPYAGRGLGNVVRLLEGNGGRLTPPWQVSAQGSVWWKIRNHVNHFELIRSAYIAARR